MYYSRLVAELEGFLFRWWWLLRRCRPEAVVGEVIKSMCEESLDSSFLSIVGYILGEGGNF